MNNRITELRQQHRKEFMEGILHSGEHNVSEFSAQADRWWPGTVQTEVEKEALDEARRDN